jgi:hypothetical protein
VVTLVSREESDRNNNGFVPRMREGNSKYLLPILANAGKLKSSSALVGYGGDYNLSPNVVT